MEESRWLEIKKIYANIQNNLSRCRDLRSPLDRIDGHHSNTFDNFRRPSEQLVVKLANERMVIMSVQATLRQAHGPGGR